MAYTCIILNFMVMRAILYKTNALHNVDEKTNEISDGHVPVLHAKSANYGQFVCMELLRRDQGRECPDSSPQRLVKA